MTHPIKTTLICNVLMPLSSLLAYMKMLKCLLSPNCLQPSSVTSCRATRSCCISWELDRKQERTPTTGRGDCNHETGEISKDWAQVCFSPNQLILGLHDDTHSHKDEHYAEGKDYLWKILGIIAGIYGFFLIERILSFLVPSQGHGHSDLPLARS
ncbi:hypothetical protein JOQ06_017785 [Pogonophryne albipinna]|uniref:Uncharacterized protein n=1 Tax=Pogonophryne albipinna TaxID=1090488 RepID=A0AAD6F8X3_9TELE|nr:hypothetical protein JOQ06_017785 [Pogonophryne albipinna]